jgi:hypothetical protein
MQGDRVMKLRWLALPVVLIAGCNASGRDVTVVTTDAQRSAASSALPTVPVDTITPGEIVPGCTPSTVGDRNVTDAEKRQLLDLYNLPRSTPSDSVRFDHRVPHALCGSDSIKDLWPEEKEASFRKDAFERAWISLVKLDPSLLPVAQACFLGDWTHCGDRLAVKP